jgi:hypothetical protein
MKPIVPVTVFSLNKTSRKVNAVFDSGSYYTIIRVDKLPADTTIIKQESTFGTANKKAKLKIIAETILILGIGKKLIKTHVLVSDELGSDMLIGAQTMQSWDISILNEKGKTKIKIVHDMRDPEINEVV